MTYQQELECINCGQKNTIRKVLLHNMYAHNDEVEFFVCINCKLYGKMFEAMTTNWEEMPYFLKEDWEWADESLLEEKVNKEDLIDLGKSNPEELRKEIAKIKDKKLRKHLEKQLEGKS